MKEVFSYEFNRIKRLLKSVIGLSAIRRDCIEFNWGYIAPRWGFELILHRGTYFDDRFAISLCFIWGFIQIRLPCRTKLGECCSTPQYGISVHGNTVWIYKGGDFDKQIGQVTSNEWWTWHLPWFTYQHDEKFHCIKTKSGAWAKSIDWEKTNAYKEIHLFLDKYDNSIIETIICRERRRWWRKGFKWLPKTFWLTKHTIDIEFKEEVGASKGSWKGGTTGCSWELLREDEPAQEALNRMQKERSF